MHTSIRNGGNQLHGDKPNQQHIRRRAKRPSTGPRPGTSVAGVTVTLLRVAREVGEDVENVDRREGVGRGGGSIATLK